MKERFPSHPSWATCWLTIMLTLLLIPLGTSAETKTVTTTFNSDLSGPYIDESDDMVEGWTYSATAPFWMSTLFFHAPDFTLTSPEAYANITKVTIKAGSSNNYTTVSINGESKDINYTNPYMENYQGMYVPTYMDTQEYVFDFSDSPLNTTGAANLQIQFNDCDYLGLDEIKIEYEIEYLGLNVAGVRVSNGNASSISNSNIQGSVSFDKNTRTLTLNNATINGSIWSYGDLTIDLKGESTITAGDSCAIMDTKSTSPDVLIGDLTIKSTDGTGSLIVTPNGYYAGIYFFANVNTALQVLGNYTSTMHPSLFAAQILGGGEGTEEHPYLIKTPTDLKTFSLYAEQELISSGYFILNNDIDCSTLTGFKAIGNNNNFGCIFDGNGKTISNLTVTGDGLFTSLRDGIVMNLTLSNCTITGDGDAGAIVGALDQSSITGCRVTGTTSVTGETAGAIVGAAYYGSAMTGNYYDYTVSTHVVGGESYTGYAHRGIGGDTPPGDDTTDDGAVLYTKQLSKTNPTNGSLTIWYPENTENGYYENNKFAPGQDAWVCVNANAGYAVESVKATYKDGSEDIVINAEYDENLTDEGDLVYTFAMPDANAQVSAIILKDIGSSQFELSIDNATYNGEAQVPATIKKTNDAGTENLTNGTDFTIKGYTLSGNAVDSPVNAGTYTVTIEGKGEYTGTSNISYLINSRDLSDATIADIPDQNFTGTAVTPEPQVSIVLKNGDEATVLAKGTDFTYSYENNTSLPTSPDVHPTVTITGTGNYTGTNNATFDIVENYDLWVKGTQVTSKNAANVTGGSTARVIYDAATSTLTLNGATIVTSNSAGIKSGLANLKVVLSGGQTEVKCTGEDYYAFEGTTENATVTFSSSTTSEGYLDITTAGYNKFFKDITPAYDGITHFDQTSVYTNEYYYHIRKSPWTGSGTEDDPYLVSTTTDLKTMSSYAYQGIVLNHYFKLNNDIDWSQETSAFNSIGRRYDNYRVFSFDGTFDGNNKTISNLTSENGLFNYVMNGGSIKNLTLTGCTVTGGSTGEDAAGLVADFRGSGKIENCSVKNSSITNNNYTNITSAGGIVGYMTNGTIDNCSIEDVTITLSGSPTYTQCAGGIVGHTYDNTTITNCEVKVNAGTTKITNTAETDQTLYAGAIVGWRERQPTLTGNTYQAGVVVETRKGNDPAVTKSGNTQRGLGDGDDIIKDNGAVLEGVKKITVTKNDKGTVEYVSGYYRVDGNDIYALPNSLSDEITVIKGTSAAGYDEPTIAIKTVTDNTGFEPVVTATGNTAPEDLYYAEWQIEMPEDDVTATILFQINLAKAARNFVIADRDYTSDPLPVTEIKTTLDDLDDLEVQFIELQSGTHFNVTDYKDSKEVTIGTTAPTNAGNYKVTIQGIGDCTGSVTLPFVISRLAITPTLIVSDWTYGGYDANENGPSLTDGSNPGNGAVTYYFKMEGENEFHEMEVSSTTDAGNYSVYATIAQSANYEGATTETKTFTIEQFDLANATVTLDDDELVYNGDEQTVHETVMAGDILVNVGYYEVSGNVGKKVGNYKLFVTAKTKDSQGNEIKNNFKGSKEIEWKIKNRTATADMLGLSDNQTYGTYFSNTESFDLPDNIVAYIITGVNGTTVTTKRISYIPEDVAVLVKSGTSTETAVDVATDNILEGTADAKDVSTITGGSVYVLYKSEFVKTITGTIPANRCYLVVSGGAGARSLGISHGDGTSTGIDNVMLDESGNEQWYDLQGRRIEKPTKAGLYIRNGEKIVVNDNNK